MADQNDLPVISPETLAAYEANRARIVNEVVERSMQRPDEVAQHGSQARQLLTVGLGYTTEALGVAMRLHDCELLLIQVRWANERLPHDGVAPQHMLTRFQMLADVVRATLAPADASAVNQYVDALIAFEQAFVQSSAHRA